MNTKSLRFTALAALLLFLNACASLPPYPVPAHNPMLASVRADISGYQHQTVTWGGIILGIETKQASSLVTVLAKPLDSNGEPTATDKSDGRFLARFTGFRDPAIFITGRELTVTGVIQGKEVHKIGDYPYLYPIVQVQHYRLWPVQLAPSSYDYNYWWYDPWYPWYSPYPWYYQPYYYPAYNPPPPTSIPMKR